MAHPKKFFYGGGLNDPGWYSTQTNLNVVATTHTSTAAQSALINTMPKRKKLIHKREMAVQALFDNGFTNKRAAMDKAGYNKNVSTGKVFAVAEVKKEIKARQKDLARRHNINQDKIITELVKMGMYGLGDLIEVDDEGQERLNWEKFTDNHRAGIKSFTTKVYKEGKGSGARQVKETKVEFVSRLAAFDSLSKHLGLFDKGNEGSEDLINKLLAARKRIRIQIDDDPDS